MDVGQFRVPEESPDDPGAFLESFQGFDRDGLQFVPGQWHGLRDPVVLDVLVHPFVWVQLGWIGWEEEQLQSSAGAGDVLFDDFRLMDR